METGATARIGAPALADMDGEQRTSYDLIAASPYGPYGPRMVLLHDPRLTKAWAELGKALGAAGLPARWREMAVLIVAAWWRADFQWSAHVEAAYAAGLGQAEVDAIADGTVPPLADADDATVAAYARQLVIGRRVDDETYRAARRLLGDAGLVQFTAFIGHYSNVAMTLVAHRVPLPPGRTPRFG